MAFSEVLKKLRNDKGMTQEKLAEVLNIPSSTIRRLETETEGIPRKERLEAIADYFNVTVDYLLGREKGSPTIELPVDFSDPSIFNKKFMYNGREISEKERDMAIRTIREILRIPEE